MQAALKRAGVEPAQIDYINAHGTSTPLGDEIELGAVERMLGDNHDYLMALHTDTPRPHVHMTVEAEGMDGKRFDPRREDLFKFREAFAEALRSRGVECEATPRWTRGQGRAGTSMALAQMREKIRRGVSRQPTETDLRQAREALAIATGKATPPAFVAQAKRRWASIKEQYEGAAARLDGSEDRRDKDLARELRTFLKDRPSIETVPDRVLKDAVERVRIAREQQSKDQEGPKSPERKPPDKMR